jgi:N-acetylglucosaminyl-diphospho-decaprenol L-rhamnosyltransferase
VNVSARCPSLANAQQDIDARVDLTIVLVSYNTSHLLERLFRCLRAASGDLNIQIIVVDNGSKDDSVALLRSKYSHVELIENASNVGFGRANNQAVSRAKGQYILLLNTDAFVASDTLAKTIEFMDSNPGYGVLGVKLVGEDGSLQPSCRYFPTPWNVFLQSTGLTRLSPHTRLVDDMSWDHASIRECDWVPGCYYLARREVVEQLGLFDPIYFLYYEEVDHCRAVRKAGWKVVYFPFTQVVHLGGESAKKVSRLSDKSRQISALQLESEFLFFRKHFGLRGVLSAFALSLLADILFLGKGLLGLEIEKIRGASTHSETLLVVLLKTRFGRRPTR